MLFFFTYWWCVLCVFVLFGFWFESWVLVLFTDFLLWNFFLLWLSFLFSFTKCIFLLCCLIIPLWLLGHRCAGVYFWIFKNSCLFVRTSLIAGTLKYKHSVIWLWNFELQCMLSAICWGPWKKKPYYSTNLYILLV